MRDREITARLLTGVLNKRLAVMFCDVVPLKARTRSIQKPQQDEPERANRTNRLWLNYRRCKSLRMKLPVEFGVSSDASY